MKTIIVRIHCFRCGSAYPWKVVVVMRENSLITPIIKKPKRLWLLALGIAITPLLMAKGWADTYNLESVDFTATSEKTDVILHTGSIVPVDKVLVSDNKLVLDIDQINTDDTVQTNFASAPNISTVIMQPLSEHKMRMIIRGEHLAPPSVAFYGNGAYARTNPEFDGNQLATETGAALKTIQNDGTQPATYDGTTGSENAAVDNAPLPAEDAAIPAPTSQRPVAAKTDNAPLALPALESGITSHGKTDFFEKWAGGNGKYIPLGLLALLLLGGAAFTVRKLSGKGYADIELEDLIDEQAHGKKVSFRDMAKAYRNKHDQPPLAASPKGKKHADDLIGLRSLNPLDLADEAPAPVQPRPAQPQAQNLEQLLSAMQAKMPKTPAVTPPPKKQAINQYLKTASKPKSKSRKAADELMYQEMKRAQDQQLQVQETLAKAPKPAIPAPPAPGANPVNRAMAARKQNASLPVNPATGRPVQPPAAQQGGPLPGNPEVLNFLRNVADLMEKDGKNDIAKSIHKNLNANNLGMI